MHTEICYGSPTQNRTQVFNLKLRYLDPNPDHADLINIFFAGMASGTAICLLSPVELVKIRSQMAIDGKRGPVSVIRELYQNGVRDSRPTSDFPT